MKKQLMPINRSLSGGVPGRLLNTPLMISEKEVHDMITALSAGQAARQQAFMPVFDPENPSEAYLAVIPVLGGLTYRGYGWSWWMTYDDIRQSFRAALADPQVRAVVLDVDSPGGEVAGVFDLVDEIYNARGQKPVYAVANENAFSAAYAIASAADEIYLSRTAAVGSVGVIAVHVETSKREADLGIKYTAVYAGDRKNDFSRHEPLSDPARKAIQQSVDRTQDLFVATVARNRGMDEEDVRATQAGIYDGQEAVDIGFADAVLSWDQAVETILSTTSNGGTQTMGITDIRRAVEEAMKTEQGKNEVTAMLAGLGLAGSSGGTDEAAFNERVEAAVNEQVEAAVNGERERACGILDLCSLAGTPDMARKLVKEGTALEAAREQIVDARAAQNGQTIQSTVGPLSTGDVNPLVADSKRRAGIER